MKKIIEKLGKKNKEIFCINGFYICETCGERLNNEIVKAINFSNEIYIGDVLERMKNKAGQILSFESSHLVNLWARCGLSSSLQQIEEGSGYEVYTFPNANAPDGQALGQRLKDPKARALETFLTSIL